MFRNWRTAVSRVVPGSAELLADLATKEEEGEWPSRGLAASRARVAHEDRGTDVTMLRWFFDWSWVHRRVENIRVLDNAQTRRHFSFDVELPVSSELRRVDGSGSQTGQINVPLLFLRRGMLVNLDIRDPEGRSMPTISSSENLAMTYRAVKQLADRVGVVDLMVTMVLADRVGEPGADRGGDQQESPDAGEEISGHCGQVVQDAILSLINTHGMDRGHFNHRTVDRHQEDHRHQLFEALGQIVYSIQSGEKRADNGSSLDVVRVPKMVKSSNPAKSGKGNEPPEEPEYVLDTSPPVDLLARTILVAADHFAPSDEKKLLDLELLCVLLATVSYSYLLCVVADEKEVWTGTASRRTVVKLACDVEPDDTRLNILNPTRQVLIRYSQTTARSTHLEFSPPENAVVQSITAPVVTHLNTPTDAGFPVKIVPFDPGLRLSGKNGDVNRDGFYRASQSRVHVEPPLFRTDPVRTLRVSLTPEQRWQAYVAGAVAGVVVGLCRLLWGDGVGGFPANPFNGGGSGADDFGGNLSVFLALETLLTAVFGALFFTTGSHRLSRQVGGPSRCAIGLAWAAAALAPAGLLAEPFGGWPNSRLWWVALVALLASGGGTAMISWSGRRPRGNVERIIRREGTGPLRKRLFDRPVQDRGSVLAVTETGAFDCHYLTDPDHRELLVTRAAETGTEGTGRSGASGTVTFHD